MSASADAAMEIIAARPARGRAGRLAWGRPGKAGAWRRAWPLAGSVLLHGVALAAFLVTGPLAEPPPPLPQIEMLAPLPVLPAPAEAMPSPADAPVKALPTPEAAAAAARVPETVTPLRSTSEKAEAAPSRPVKRRRPPKPDQPVDPVPREARETPLVPPSEAAAIPVSGASSERHTVLGDPAPAAAPAGPPPDYIGLIRALLEKAKRYPAEARAEGREGTVFLCFTLEQGGKLLKWRIERGSGVASLDEEAGRMIQAATPFPPFPATVERQRMTLVVPVEFLLKRP